MIGQHLCIMVSILVYSHWLNIHFVWLFSGWGYSFYHWLIYSSCIFKPNHTFRDGSCHWTSAPESCSPDCTTGATLTNCLLLTNFPDSPLSLFPCYILVCSWDASVFCSICFSLDLRFKKFYFLCKRALVLCVSRLGFWRQRWVFEWLNSLYHFLSCICSMI